MFEIPIRSHLKCLHPNPIQNNPTKIDNELPFSITSNSSWSSHVITCYLPSSSLYLPFIFPYLPSIYFSIFTSSLFLSTCDHMFLEETRTLTLPTRRNAQLVFICLLTALNMVQLISSNMVVDILEHGYWQTWTCMVVDILEHGCWQPWTWLLTALNMVVDSLEHGCWHAWT